MSKIFCTYTIAALLVISFCSILFVVSSTINMPSALAQGTNPTADSSTAAATSAPVSPTIAPTPVPGAPPITNAADILWLVGLTLLGTILLWGILFGYTGWIQGKYFDITARLAQRSITVAPTIIGTAPFVALESARDGDPQTPRQLKIAGPASVVVGVQSSEFKATKENGAAATIDVNWSVDPADAAAVNPPTGSATRVTATRSGVFTLKAAAPGPPAANASIAVAVVTPQTTKIDLPTFGRGYGSIAVVIVLLAIVLILGLTGILPAAAIATLLGGLVGYIVQSRLPASSNTPAAGAQTITQSDQ